jgi:chromosome segregation ATPase
MDENSDNMHLLYIQKQEQLLLENLRAKVDYEIKMHILNDRSNQQLEQIKQLQMTLQTQQELNKQAVESFERVSFDNNTLKATVARLEERTKQLEVSAHELTTKTIEFNNARNAYESRIKDLQTELNRQAEELERLYNQPNSKKKRKPELLVEQSTDSGTF